MQHIIDAEHLYKEETGSYPVPEEELEFMVWRSKGQWVIDISDQEKLQLNGRESLIRFERTDPDYLRFLEEKVMELLIKVQEYDSKGKVSDSNVLG